MVPTFLSSLGIRQNKDRGMNASPEVILGGHNWSPRASDLDSILEGELELTR